MKSGKKMVLTALLAGGLTFFPLTGTAWAEPVAIQDIQDSEEAQARMQKGISLYQQGQYAAALTEVQLVAEKYPTYAVAYRMTGLCQFQLRKYPEAVESLRKAVQLTQEQEKRDDQAARIALGRALFYAEKYPDAVTELTYAVKQKPNDATNFYLLGFAHYKLNQEPEAVANLLQAVSLNDKDPAPLKVLSEIYLSRVVANSDDKAAVTKATETVTKLKAIDSSPEAANTLGTLFLVTRQFAKAAPEFERVVTAQPQNGLAQFNLGLSLSRSDQFGKAAPVLVKASELLPTNVDVLRELGYVYEKDRKTEKAREVYEKANQLTNGQDEYFKNALERVKQK
ncbi:MAG: tetratricopeptide repeat protein [Blastocatellia bacterium]|nr:tetratricopeptide repeat protein [Blastocatellia bacterium]